MTIIQKNSSSLSSKTARIALLKMAVTSISDGTRLMRNLGYLKTPLGSTLNTDFSFSGT